MPQVTSTLTPLSYGQALGALLAAGCPQSALLMVGAQSAVETAGWKSMHGWNFGNITPTSTQAANGPWMTQGLQGMKFIVYPDAVSGARGMLRWLSTHGLLPFAVAGDLPGYVSRLQATCYVGCIGLVDGTGHTVSQTDYTNYQAGLATWMKKLSGVTPIPPDIGIDLIDVALVSAGALAVVVAAIALARPEWISRYT